MAYGTGAGVPVKVDGEYEVKIEAIGAKGDGVAKIKGFTIFVRDAQVNDEVRIRVSKIMGTFAFAEVIN
jgi:translation initiation factor 2 subunit 2